MEFSLKLIPFVSPSEELANNTAVSSSQFESGLSANEACSFYNSIISLPSCQPIRTQVLKKEAVSVNKNKTQNNLNFKKESIFRLAQEGNLVEIKKFVTAGYPINQQDPYGWTPLMCSICAGHKDVVQYLVKHGANIHTKCKQGMTAIDIGHKSKHFSIVELLERNRNLERESICSISSANQNFERFCDTCKVNYKTSTLTHKRSIAHLLGEKKFEHSTFYHIPENNKGFQMMLRSGWNKEKGLGLNADGRKFPIKTVLKKDRTCIGRIKDMSKITHFNANDLSAVDKPKRLSVRAVREKTLKKWQRKKLDQISRQQEINFRRQFH